MARGAGNDATRRSRRVRMIPGIDWMGMVLQGIESAISALATFIGDLIRQLIAALIL